jgi:predicted nucleotidyltransferase component of viral defense system
MITIKELISKAYADGYDENAEAKVCQDVVLKAISESTLSRNVTIKGGVVMQNISKDSRRATQDIDMDFIRYSLSDESILTFIRKLDCLEGFHIDKTGDITELKQQEYHGKRVHVIITDDTGDSIESKIDLGVHKNLDIDQEEYCFDIACYDGSATLLINTKEQMFTEKLRSLLKFGQNSTRYKDIFDMYYLSDKLDTQKLLKCMNTFIISDPGMKENDMDAVANRVKRTFSSQRYVKRLIDSKKNWIDEEVPSVIESLIEFLEKLE